MKLDVPLKVDVAAGPNWLDVDRCLEPRHRSRVIGLIGGDRGREESTAAAMLRVARRVRGRRRRPGPRGASPAPDVASTGRRALGQSGVRKPDGSLDRRAIGRIVFADPAERTALEESGLPVYRPAVSRGDRRGLADRGRRFVVLDAAVMLEAGWNNETATGSSTSMRPATCASPGSPPAAAGPTPTWPPARPPSCPDDVKKARADATSSTTRHAGAVAGTGRSVC